MAVLDAGTVHRVVRASRGFMRGTPCLISGTR